MPPKLPLPRGWKRRIPSSVLHIRAFGHFRLLEQRTFARRTWPSTPATRSGFRRSPWRYVEQPGYLGLPRAVASQTGR